MVEKIIVIWMLSSKYLFAKINKGDNPATTCGRAGTSSCGATVIDEDIESFFLAPQQVWSKKKGLVLPT